MNGLYLHVPFCEKKCTYCDFYSIESTGLIDRFVQTLCKEIEIRCASLTVPRTENTNGIPSQIGKTLVPFHANTIFFGGGTPSLLSGTQLEKIISTLKDHVDIDPNAEWTMECNPGTISEKSLSDYRAAGINRVSFGIQSFAQPELDFLTRIHSIQEALDAIPTARAAGFTNINADLMFALPPQTVASLEHSLQTLIDLQPDHISAYSLVYEPGTPLHAQLGKGLVVPHNEEFDAEMYHIVMHTLQQAGYEQYEVSNFARPGKQCAHNLMYWHGHDYLAFGPSAHGLVNTERYWNHRSLSTWQAKVDAGELPQANTENLSHNEQAIEYAFLHVRSDGLPFSTFQQRFGLDLQTMLQPHLQHWIDADFVTINNGVLRLTFEGYRVCDEISLKIIQSITK
ncbi:MAG: radical SAM family heme chaperone HemW [Ignavibacteria bacterium]|nr:radical SAM family heme chaperone HemW [Ignavibacteria bacterium]